MYTYANPKQYTTISNDKRKKTTEKVTQSQHLVYATTSNMEIFITYFCCSVHYRLCTKDFTEPKVMQNIKAFQFQIKVLFMRIPFRLFSTFSHQTKIVAAWTSWRVLFIWNHSLRDCNCLFSNHFRLSRFWITSRIPYVKFNFLRSFVKTSFLTPFFFSPLQFKEILIWMDRVIFLFFFSIAAIFSFRWLQKSLKLTLDEWNGSDRIE